jgi:sRNA-binding regulator protein Hfq
MINRKLVRPNLAEIKERMAHQPHAPGPAAPGAQRETGGGNGAPVRRRPAPAELTNAEAFYYLKQMNGRTPMVVILENGEQLRGHIEWYDRGCLKIHRTEGPNLLVFKHSIRYLYKQEEENQTSAGEP